MILQKFGFNPRAERLAAPEHAAQEHNEFEHFILCPICQQPVDCRDLGEVMRHAELGHERPA